MDINKSIICDDCYRLFCTSVPTSMEVVYNEESGRSSED